MTDREVIDAFVAHLGDHNRPGLRVERRPDEENRDSSYIDAIAGPFAIEHTSIDTLPNQRRDSDWFIRAAGGLEQELGKSRPFRLKVTLNYDAVGKGQDWAVIRAALKRWVINEAHHLPDGTHVIGNLSNVPFQLHVEKSSRRSPGIFFARYVPNDDTLAHRVRQTFDRKAAKLAKYVGPGAITALLVESDDIALMNDLTMLEAIRTAYPSGPPPGVDQIWYADTSIPSAPEFREFTWAIRSAV
jgi:hypothetical protein